MANSREISLEYDRLVSLTDEKLEAAIGKKVPHRALGRELAVMNYLAEKHGQGELNKAIDSQFWEDPN